MKIKQESIKAYALKNAIEHKGKANLGSVINSLFNEGLKKENIKTNFTKVISDFANEEALTLIDLTDVAIKNKEKKLYYPADTHPTEIAAEIFSEEIAQRLKETLG